MRPGAITRRRTLAGLAGLIGFAAGCQAGLDQRLALVDEPRVLAIVAEPAEARPGAMVTYRALVAGPDGPIAAAPRWSFCTTPKPPTEDNVVSRACVDGDDLIELGAAAAVTATLPAEGCLRFGPDTPPGGFRPRDADTTGGYYQPVRVEVAGTLSIGLTRITCKLPNAPADVARDYDLRYAANRNPTLEPVALATVPALREVALTASWPVEAAETYLFYDRVTQRLLERREALRLSWFASGGTLAVDASAVGEDELATSVSTTWTTPAAGPAWLWLVLRDSRGGVATLGVALTVE